MTLSTKTIFSFILVPLFVAGLFLSSFNPVLAQTEKRSTPAGCVSLTSLNPAACAAWVAVGMLTASGYLTWIGGLALNYAVDITILKMGDAVNSIEGIQYGWAVLRDIANIGLIFGLLAIGIGIILQISSFGSREILARLIIIAILLNFSLFITKAVVAVGNSFAIVAYSQLNSRTGNCTGGTACISDKFVAALMIPTVYKSVAGGEEVFNAEALNVPTADGWKIFLAGLFGSIFLIITGFVFLAGAILLIIRFVVLVLLMITAPVAWIAHILPTTDGLWKTWWSSLLKETFFAPAYLILLLITLYIAQDSALGSIAGGGREGGFAAMLSGKASSVALVVYFGIITGFMIAALILARKIGSYGSSAVTSFGQKLGKNAWSYARRGAGAATFGAAGLAGRNIIGRPAYNAVQKEGPGSLKAKVAQGGLRGLVAQAQLGAAKYASKASYDARALPGVKDLGIGKPIKGYEAVRKQQEKSYADYAKSLGKKNAPEYAKNVLEQPTFFSKLFMRTAARQKAAGKILEPLKDKAERKRIKKAQQALKDEMKQLDEELAPLLSGIQRDEPRKQQLQARRLKIVEELDDLDEELDELKEKATSRKEEDKDKGGKKEGGEGDKDKK